jgi:hypothetical protein
MEDKVMEYTMFERILMVLKAVGILSVGLSIIILIAFVLVTLFGEKVLEYELGKEKYH